MIVMQNCNEDRDDHKDCVEVHEDLDLCHQVIDAVQLGLHLGPSSPELPWLGLIIGILMYYNTINIFHTTLFIPDSFVG